MAIEIIYIEGVFQTALKNRVIALMKHTTIGMTAQRICRWLFHFLLHFGANIEKNIASTPLAFPSQYKLLHAFISCIGCVV